MILRCVFLAAMFAFQVRCLKPEGCDPSLNSWFREGILGQVGMFPWLGVIRVQLYEGVEVRIALTGAVLINENFALTIADDIARIPRKIFQRDSKALFIPTDGQPWLCKLKKYTTHPEYSTYKNTIALIELELENKGPVPLVPICWPTHSYSYSASSQLHVFGITDANDVLEKEVYKVQHVPQSECIQWYRREGLEQESDSWRDYQCVATENNKKQCVYETGMILASNATGTWTLIGFGLHGPGCAAPSRFIQIYKYIPWIESTISNAQNGESLANALRDGSEDDTPAHLLYSKNVSPYDFQWYETGLGTEVVRLDKDAIVIFTSQFELTPRDCFHKSKLIYSDSIKIYADRQTGKANYKLSLMDAAVVNFTKGCVLVRLDAEEKSRTRLWYNYGNYIEPLDMREETPKEFLKKYLSPEWHNTTKTQNTTTPTTSPSSSSTTTATTPARILTTSPTTELWIPHFTTTKTTPSTTAAKLNRVQRRVINNIRRYKKLISNSVINELEAIKNKLETTRKELNAPGKADVSKISKKMFAIKRKLKYVRDNLGIPVPDSLKDSISILDKAASELRAGLIYYQGKLMDARKAEVQKSIDLLKKFGELPETIEIKTTTDKPEKKVEANKKRKAKGRQGATKKEPWKPHKLLEPQYITDRPGWWLTHKHLNVELDFLFNSEAELKIEIWAYTIPTKPTPRPEVHTTKTRTQTTTTKETTDEENEKSDTSVDDVDDGHTSKTTSKADDGDNSKSTSKVNDDDNSKSTSKADDGDNSKSTSKADDGDNSKSTSKADDGDNSKSTSKADDGDNSKSTSKSKVNDDDNSKSASKADDGDNSKSTSKADDGDNSKSTSKADDGDNSKSTSKVNDDDNSKSASKADDGDNSKSTSKADDGDNSKSTSKADDGDNSKSTSKSKVNDDDNSKSASKADDGDNSKSTSKADDGDNSKSTSKADDGDNSKSTSKVNDDDNSKSASKADDGDNSKSTSKADDGDNSKSTSKADDGDNSKSTSKADDGDNSKSTSKADDGDRSPENDDDNNPKDSRKRLPSREKFFLTFLRKDAKFKTYSELKRAEYNDFEVIQIRGIDLYDELTDDSDIVSSGKLSVVAVVFCLLLGN